MSGRRRFFAAAVAACLIAGVVFGADDNKVIYPGSNPRSETAAPAAAGGMGSLTLVLGFALAGVGGWLVWRNRHRTAGGSEQRSLDVEETRSLGNRQYLVVASYEGKKFLLGVCPGRIDLLAPLEGVALRTKADE